jgi:hypothetical protein
MPTINGIEVLDNIGRVYVNGNESNFKKFIQDDEKTLDFFINDKDVG